MFVVVGDSYLHHSLLGGGGITIPIIYQGVSEDICYSLLRGVIILLKGVLRIELCMKVHRSINKKIFTIKNL